MAKHPMQPLEIADDGAVWFKPNAIIQWLHSTGKLDLNEVACLPNISKEDHQQLAQLLGYSLDGYAGLPYMTGKAFRRAERKALKTGWFDGPTVLDSKEPEKNP